MTNKQLDTNRLTVVKDYLGTGELLNLSGDFELSVSSSTPSIYHVYFGRADRPKELVHQYSMSDIGLKNLVDNLSISTIKRIFIESRVLRLRNRKVLENSINPLDHENSH